MIPAQAYDHSAAKAYCGGLALDGLSSGWRLPRAKELESLIDRHPGRSGGLSLTDTRAFPVTVTNKNSQMWSATAYAYPRPHPVSWLVSAWDGTADTDYDENPAYIVRCVHDGSP